MANLNNIRISKRIWCLLLILLGIYLLHTIIRDNKRQGFINLRQLLQVSIQAVESGGREIIAVKDKYKINNKGITKEGANESVTTADFNSNCAIIKGIQSVYPYVKIISEESDASCDKVEANLEDSPTAELNNLNDEWIKYTDITMWIDPLDATQEFTENLFNYVTVMACVAIKGKAVIGVIHNPFLKETVWAWVKQGHSSNLITKDKSSTVPTFIVSRSHAGKAREFISDSFNSVEIITAAGAGYKALEVARGNADVYLHITKIKKWDICAGNAVISALNGEIITLENNEINYTDPNPVNNEGILATLGDFNEYLALLGGNL